MNNDNKILLSIGSNFGDREHYIKLCIELLKSYVFVKDFKISSIYETEPIGEKFQNNFLNLAVSGITHLNKETLIFILKSIEYAIGRNYRGKWQQREIDIDIILFNSEIYKVKSLEIPHPEMKFRKFVLLPSSEIEPELINPITNKTIKELLTECEDNSSLKIY